MKFSFITPYPEDLAKINTKPCHSLGELVCAEEMIAISHQSRDSICLAIVADKEIIGVAGSYRSWPGVAQAWAIFGKELDKYPIAFTKACLSMIQYAAKEQELKRLSLTVRKSYDVGNCFAEGLGFEFEGVMKSYLPDGEDAKLYARIF